MTKRNVQKRFAGALMLLLSCLCPFISTAQQRPEMADILRSNGKIYIVVLVICTIFVGIIITLFYLERRIKKLENNQSDITSPNQIS